MPGIPARRGDSRVDHPIPAAPDGEHLCALLSALNVALVRRGSKLRVAATPHDRPERDRLSVRLMVVLKETRDRRALEILYRLNARTIHLFARQRLRGAPDLDAADVVDETFLRIFTRCETFSASDRSTFAGWAMAIAENVIRHLIRTERRGGRVPWATIGEEPSDLTEPIDHATTEEARRVAIEGWPMLVRLCAAGILRLPPRWRSALELRERDGLSYREIASRMDLRPGHVAMLLHRARGRVLQHIAGTLAAASGARPYLIDPSDRIVGPDDGGAR